MVDMEAVVEATVVVDNVYEECGHEVYEYAVYDYAVYENVVYEYVGHGNDSLKIRTNVVSNYDLPQHSNAIVETIEHCVAFLKYTIIFFHAKKI
jgi:hypothetical protein